MTEQQQEIQNRIRQIKQQRANALHVPTNKPAASGWKWTRFVPAFLGSCIVLLTVATIGLLANKKGEGQQIARVETQRRQSQPIFVPSQPITVDTSGFLTSEDADKFLSTSEGESMVAGVHERLDSLEAEVETWQHRTWLLGMAVTENANIAKKYHNAGYITFNGDWKMNRMPTTMHLSEETKAKLREADLAFEATTGKKISCDNHHYVMESDNQHYHCTNCGVRYAKQHGGFFKRCR